MKEALAALVAAVALAGWGLSAPARAQSPDALPTGEHAPGFVAESGRFAFFSHYWLNMHHFLYRQATRAQGEEGRHALISAEGRKALSEADEEVLGAAVAFYDDNLAEKDLRSSDYMQAFKSWAVHQGRENLASSAPASLRAHAEQLAAFDAIYARHFWDAHREASRNIVSENLPLIRATEDTVARSLADWSRSYWPSGKVRVDVTYYAKPPKNTAFTTIFPVHVVVPAKGQGAPRGSWVEILYHEAGHQLVRARSGFVAGTIEDVSEVTGRSLRSLWHAYLHYFAGTAAERALRAEGVNGYEMYMTRNDTLGLYIPSLQEYLPAYISREATLAEVTRSIIEDVRERAGWD